MSASPSRLTRIEYERFEPNQTKHLEMVQAVIARLGNDSFLVKGWAVTVTGVFLGFAVDSGKEDLALASLAPTALFWALDATYLRSERLFRVLYDQVRTSNAAPFFMGATTKEFCEGLTGPDADKASWVGTLFRPALWLFYGALAGAAVVTAALIC